MRNDKCLSRNDKSALANFASMISAVVCSAVSGSGAGSRSGYSPCRDLVAVRGLFLVLLVKSLNLRFRTKRIFSGISGFFGGLILPPFFGGVGLHSASLGLAAGMP